MVLDRRYHAGVASKCTECPKFVEIGVVPRSLLEDAIPDRTELYLLCTG